LVANGVTCLYVSHRLEEVFATCDHITVLRDGKQIQTTRADETNPDEVVRAMIGRELEEDIQRPPHSPQEEVLVEVSNLTSAPRFRGISFQIRRGEILGLAGLVGSGRTEVAEALFGLDPAARGGLTLAGRPLKIRHPAEALANRMGLVPEDRKRHGLVLALSVAANITLPILGSLSRFGVLRSRQEEELARGFIERLRIRTPSGHTTVASLSGGNQQKVVLAKWLAANCDFLMIDEPTRGVDVGAKAEIHGLIRGLAAEGKAILLISSDMPELFALCHRLLVLREGRLAGELARDAFDAEHALRLMTGLTKA
jgi:ABC-type sugar transport system ATPase subunit